MKMKVPFPVTCSPSTVDRILAAAKLDRDHVVTSLQPDGTVRLVKWTYDAAIAFSSEVVLAAA